MAKSYDDLQLRSLFFADSRGEQFISAFFDNNNLLKSDLLNASSFYDKTSGNVNFRDGEVHNEVIDLVINTAKKHALLDPSLRARSLVGEFINRVPSVEPVQNVTTVTYSEFKEFIQNEINKIIASISLTTSMNKILFFQDKINSGSDLGRELLNIDSDKLLTRLREINAINPASVDSELKNFIIGHFTEKLKFLSSGEDYPYDQNETKFLLDNIYYGFSDLNARTKDFYSKYTTVMKRTDVGKWVETSNFSRSDRLRINLKNNNSIPLFAYDLPTISRMYTAFYYTSASGRVERVSMEYFSDDYKERLFYNLYLSTYITMCQELKRGTPKPYSINVTSMYDTNARDKYYTLQTAAYGAYSNLHFSIMTNKLVADKLSGLSVEYEMKNKMRNKDYADELIYDFYASNIFYRNVNGNLVYRDQMGKVIELGDIANFLDDNCYLAELANTERQKCDEFLAKCIFGEDAGKCTDYLKAPDNNVELGKFTGVWHPQILLKLLDAYGFLKINVDSPKHGCKIKVYESVSDWLSNPSRDVNVQTLKDVMKENNEKANKLKQYFQSHVDKINNNPAILNPTIHFFKLEGQKCVSNQRNYWLESMGIELRSEPANKLSNKDFLVINGANKLNLRNFGVVSPNLKDPMVVAQYGGASIPTSGYAFINEIFMKALRKLDSIGVRLDRASMSSILSTLESLKNNEKELVKTLSVLDRYYEIYNAYGESVVNNVAGTTGYRNLESVVKNAEDNLSKQSQYERELNIQLNRLMKLEEKYKVKQVPKVVLPVSGLNLAAPFQRLF